MSIEHDIETGKSDLHNISGLVGDAMAQVAKLFQNEVDLAKAELGEKVQRVGKAFGLLVGSALLVIPAIVMALFALSSALITAGWSPTLAYLTSAVVAAAISGALFAIGIKRLDARSLAPRETIRQLEKDKDTVKGMVR
jgi:Putative Actinobacterial Holin-X, holin superfamily III